MDTGGPWAYGALLAAVLGMHPQVSNRYWRGIPILQDLLVETLHIHTVVICCCSDRCLTASCIEAQFLATTTSTRNITSRLLVMYLTSSIRHTSYLFEKILRHSNDVIDPRQKGAGTSGVPELSQLPLGAHWASPQCGAVTTMARGVGRSI